MKNKKEPKENLEIKDEEAMSSEEEITDPKAETEQGDQDLNGDSQVIGGDLDLVDQLEDLRTSLEEMEAKTEEYLDGWQRSRAEFANYKKRILREQAEIHQTARGEVIKLYLDIADDLERALEKMPDDGDGDIWATGIKIIFQKLISRLESEGIRPMDALGQEFDPNIHEAIMKEESEEHESGQIIEVMQEGYWIGEKVLTKQNQENTEENNGENHRN
jgi:molecular chaperone GrpE